MPRRSTSGRITKPTAKHCPLFVGNSNQIRHTYATKVRKDHGAEASQVMLSHSRMSTTEVYAERNEALGVALAAKIG